MELLNDGPVHAGQRVFRTPPGVTFHLIGVRIDREADIVRPSTIE
jgi:hypothetical protein